MESFEVKCYACGEKGLTVVKDERSGYQWLLCVLIALLCGSILCLCLIPLCCCKKLRRYDHFCHHCGTHVACRYPRD